MDMFLNEMDSVKTLSEIRVNKGAKVANDATHNLNGSTTVTIKLEIEPYNNIWNRATFQATLNNNDSLEDIGFSSNYSIFLNNNQNSDRLIIANNKTQQNNNSNIFEIAYFFVNSVWIPVAKGELTVSEQEWCNLMPDVFQLVPELDFSKIDYRILESKFDYVTLDKQLSGFLHAEFFMGKQPISIFYSEFYDFCKKYEIL